MPDNSGTRIVLKRARVLTAGPYSTKEELPVASYRVSQPKIAIGWVSRESRVPEELLVGVQAWQIGLGLLPKVTDRWPKE